MPNYDIDPNKGLFYLVYDLNNNVRIALADTREQFDALIDHGAITNRCTK